MPNTVTAVLSGPGDARAKIMAALSQAGFDVEQSDEGRHGFDSDEKGQPKADGQAFVTVHTTNPDEAIKVTEAFGWQLRAHWTKTGEWIRTTPGGPIPDPMSELQKLEARIRAAGVKI